ncbi:MAG: helix-turn-helix domain-containing protein, partial [Duncaniella sp.]|nr:helix-turn-helix domain-containing protein [Duncaniella sp.]
GVYMATPHNIYTRGYIPQIVFTTLAVYGGVGKFCMPPRDEITLDAHSRNVSVCFAAIDFVGNEDILYRTRLDGSPWTTANRMRNVTLFNLAPGEHILEVQSTDRYGRWVDNAKSLKINVQPFWHETLWARLLFTLMIIGFASAVIYTYIYVRRVNSHRRELLSKYMTILREREEWTKALVEEPKTVISEMDALEIGHKPEDVAFLDKVRRYIQDNIGNSDANVDDMGEAVAASRSTLNRRLRSLMGVSASQLLNEARMQHAEELLRSDNRLSVSDVAQACGFSDKYYFQRVFKKKFGVSPSEYRNAAE